jgi:hypothetical protein
MLTGASPGRRAFQHRLDIDDRRSVDGFNRSNSQAVSLDGSHNNGVKAQRVWPIRRAGRKHTSQPVARIGSRMDFQYVPLSFMQPRDHEDLITNVQTLKRTGERGTDLEPRIWCAFGSLPGRVAPSFQRRRDCPDRPQLGIDSLLGRFPGHLKHLAERFPERTSDPGPPDSVILCSHRQPRPISPLFRFVVF